jgi:Ser/Thr protein kinase RdoA (MazF antagonist)
MLYVRGRLTGVLDFDFAHPDLRAADLAVSSMVTEDDAAVALIEGYLEVEPLPRQELDLIGLLERARALGAVAALLSLRVREPGLDNQLAQVAKLLFRVEQRWPSLSRRLGLA